MFAADKIRDAAFTICAKCAIIKYDDKHINVMPNEKFKALLGLISCHKNGIANIKIGKAVMPSVLLTAVNQQAVTIIK